VDKPAGGRRITMSDQELGVQVSGDEAIHLLELTEKAVNSKDLPELAQEVLPILVKVTGVTAAVLYFEKYRPSAYSFFQAGVHGLTGETIENIGARQFHQIPLQTDFQPLLLSLSPQETTQVALFLLHDKGKRLGLLGLLIPENRKLPNLALVEKVVFLLTQFIAQLLRRLAYEKKLAEFNAYFAVSSKIARAMNLRDVIEAVLYSSMEAVSAEAASVMLLDNEKKTFSSSGWCLPSRPLWTPSFPLTRVWPARSCNPSNPRSSTTSRETPGSIKGLIRRPVSRPEIWWLFPWWPA